MSLQFKKSNQTSENQYFLYLKAGKILKSVFTQEPVLSGLFVVLAYVVLVAAGFNIGKLKQLGGKILQIHKRLNAVVVEFNKELTPETTKWLKDTLKVELEPVRRVTACMYQTVEQTHVVEVWNKHNLDGTNVKVAVVDTGVDDSHYDLKDRVIARKDFTDSPFGIKEWVDQIRGVKKRLDPVGHGTHCAGSIGAHGTKYRGVAPKVAFIDARVLGDNGSGTTSSVVKGMSWAATQGADIISMSLGGPGTPDDAISREANALAEDGIVVVVAAGNEGPASGTIGSPGAAEKVITVGAVDKSNYVTSYSSRGPVHSGQRTIDKPDIVAPGGGVSASNGCNYFNGVVATKSLSSPKTPCTVDHSGKLYEKMSGTSMATPHVAGICALLVQASGLTRSNKNRCKVIKDIIKTTAVKMAYGTLEVGAGLINAEAAVQAIIKETENVSI